MSTAPILFEEKPTACGRRVAFATMNAEKSLNSLTLDMIRLFYPQLKSWEADPGICCIVLQGAGEKALCAGGDIRHMYEAMVEHPGPELNNPFAASYFAEEYRLDYSIHTCPKPFLCWGHGIVMGGGIGLMNGASHRVVTERSRLAMPEITIGLYPDVGGSWFLNRMPGRTGLYLALTGASLNAADSLRLNLADHFLPAAQKETVYQILLSTAWTDNCLDNKTLLSRRLGELERDPGEHSITSNVWNHYDFIQQVTSGHDLREIIGAINGANHDDSWIAKCQSALHRGSPTSAMVLYELYRRAKHLSLSEVFRLEYGVSLQFAAHPDFTEGVRALLIDKDNNPSWTPPTYDLVTAEWIEEHFAAPCPDEEHPLRDL